MTLIIEAHEQCKKCFHFQVCSSVLKNDLLIRESMLREKEPKCKMFVEVVRCKDCKHWLYMEAGFGDCTNGRFHLDGHADPTMNADDFCSCGERRTDG